jgi:hypothetical protein
MKEIKSQSIQFSKSAKCRWLNGAGAFTTEDVQKPVNYDSCWPSTQVNERFQSSYSVSLAELESHATN